MYHDHYDEDVWRVEVVENIKNAIFQTPNALGNESRDIKGIMTRRPRCKLPEETIQVGVNLVTKGFE